MIPEMGAGPIGRALWYIESHLANDFGLDDVARASGVTRYHLARGFVAATGWPVMRYVRVRRLTEAARRLADGARDILSVALEASYGSHEAFTRAFVETFERTPQDVRDARSLAGISLLEPLRKDAKVHSPLTQPRIERAPLLLVAGLSQRYSGDSMAGIPSQWQRFAPYVGHLESQAGPQTYGVRSNMDDNGTMDYLCGVAVSTFARLPEGFATLRIPPHRYAVFTHDGHIAAIRATWEAAFANGLPSLGARVDDAPDFERYDERFDPQSGLGTVEIWIPIVDD